MPATLMWIDYSGDESGEAACLCRHLARKTFGEMPFTRLNWRLKFDQLLKPVAKQTSLME